MPGTLQLKDILSDLKNVSSNGVTKTAQVKTASAVKSAPDAKKELLSVLQDAVSTTKTASAAPKALNVSQEVVKIASELAASENEALVKEAHLYGAAVADGFMARLNQYENAAGHATKTASYEDSEAGFEKFASENPELVKQAVELGYQHGKMQIEQAKTAAFNQGYADTMAQIEQLSKTAAGQDELRKIAAELNPSTQMDKTAAELTKWANTDEGRQLMPFVKQGYEETMSEINKLASDTFSRGYRDTIKILGAM